MKKSVVAVMLALCALTDPSISSARKTYSLQEIEAMKKAGKFTGTERFVIIRGKEASTITGDKTEIPTLVPQGTTAKEEASLTAMPEKKVKEENIIPAPEVKPEKVELAPEVGNNPVNVEPQPTPVREKAAPAALPEPIAYDKIGNNRFLITMAREYYGNGDFWVYIYEENRAKLGHPDRITPGTSVIIPSLKKYGVDPGKPADGEKAKRLAKEVYARFGKKI